MPRGDKTLVGERGWKLSGGQKTRLNLARYGQLCHISTEVTLTSSITVLS